LLINNSLTDLVLLQSTNIPLDYIDSIQSKRHILLLYEDIHLARLVMFRFLKNGLLQGERCLYAMDDDPVEIVLKMLSYGISLSYFQSKQLRVHSIHNTSSAKEEILENARREIVKLLSGFDGSYRIVSRVVPNIDTVNGISAEIDLERQAHMTFDGFNGSIMCPYDLSRIEETRRAIWLKELRENHHDVIYIPRSGQAGVFFQKDIPVFR